MAPAVAERLCLSVFCDELDHQINLYDSGEIERPEAIPDVLANLQEVLDENTDRVVIPRMFSKWFPMVALMD